MNSKKVCEYSRSRSFHDDLILQDQASGERSQDQWSSGIAWQRQAIETEWGFLFNLRGLFLQSVGFPFDSQGPGSSRNFSLLLSHYKAIKNGNQTVLSIDLWEE